MSIFVPKTSHLEIINEIGRWKVVPLRALFEEVGQEVSYQLFCRNVKKLAMHGLIKSYQGPHGANYLALTSEGGKISQYACPYIESEIELNHDLLSSMVLRSLLRFANFQSGHVIHNDEPDLVPDAIIHAIKGQEEYSLAIEVELTQKNRKRILEKFSKYSKTNQFTHVLYVTNKEGIFDSYRKIISEMNELVSRKVILLVEPKLSHTNFEYQTARCWFKGKEAKFDEIFG